MTRPHSQYHCVRCGNPVSALRWERAGMHTCLPCGEAQARDRRHCAVPLSKSNYVLVTDPAMLRQLNPKHPR